MSARTLMTTAVRRSSLQFRDFLALHGRPDRETGADRAVDGLRCGGRAAARRGQRCGNDRIPVAGWDSKGGPTRAAPDHRATHAGGRKRRPTDPTATHERSTGTTGVWPSPTITAGRLARGSKMAIVAPSGGP